MSGANSDPVDRSDSEWEIDQQTLNEDHGTEEMVPLAKLTRHTDDERSSVSDTPTIEHYDDPNEKRYQRRRGRRPTEPDNASGVSYSAEEERQVVKQLDRKLVLFLAFLYMLSFLDRSSE